MTPKPRLLPAALALALLAPGCTALSALGEASQPLEVYELRAPDVGRASFRRDVEVVVAEPVASGALATDRIMIRPTPLQAQYLPGVRWADIAPVMVQTLLVRGLTETGAFRSVGRTPVATVPDYTVLGELTDFQAENRADGAGVVVRARIVFRMVRESDARVTATRAFTVTEPAGGLDEASVVAAFDRAATGLLAAAVAWIVSAAPAAAS